MEIIDTAVDMFEAHEKNVSRAIRQSTKTGGRVILKECKLNCPVSEDGNFKHKKGNLKRSLALKVLRPKIADKALSLIGARIGKKEKFDGWYVRLVENGTAKTAPKPFLRKSHDAVINKAMEVSAITFYQELDNIAAKDIKDIAEILIED